MADFDYSKLLGRIKESGLTQAELAAKIPMNASTLNLKLNNKGDFSQPEIVKICNVLSIPAADVQHYFFAH